MELKITEKKSNPLLGRTEVLGSLKFEGATPSNAQLAESLAKEFKTDISKVVMKHINTKFSMKQAEFTGFVYDDDSSKAKVERVTKHMKKKMEAARKKAEEERKAKEEEAAKAAEEKKAAEEAKKSEESKEETPAEAAPSEEAKEVPEEKKEEPAQETTENKESNEEPKEE